MNDNLGEPAKLPYLQYEQVPVYRRQWFFWICWIIFSPLALLLLVTGDVYYVRQGRVRNFGIANRIVAAVLALVWAYGLVEALLGAG